MSASEFTDWIAFERVWGPLPIHERLDIGLAHACLILAQPYTKKELHLRDFLPPWYHGAQSQSEDELLRRAKQLMEVVGHPDDQHAHR